MANNFTGELVARQLTGGYRWEIWEAFSYRVGDANSDVVVRVPKGFITDFASIPRGLWNIWPPAAGKHSKPAVVHDALYWRGWIEAHGVQKRITRKEADDIFKEALEVAGVNWLSRQIIYAGVRVGGSSTWNRYRWVDGDVETSD